MEKLLNKIILKVELNDENDRIYFLVSDEGNIKRIAYQVEGDCCSRSWFYTISGIKNLLNRKVIEVIRKELPEPEESDKDGNDSLEDYGVTLKTEKGYCDLVYRNESNGYYGGYLSEAIEDPTDAVTREIFEDADGLV